MAKRKGEVTGDIQTPPLVDNIVTQPLSGIRVVEEGNMKPQVRGSNLYVTIEGKNQIGRAHV